MNRITNISFGTLILCLLLFSSPSYAKPSIEWNPSKLNIEQMQGTQSSHVATAEHVNDFGTLFI